jgi:hypothetical protein
MNRPTEKANGQSPQTGLHHWFRVTAVLLGMVFMLTQSEMRADEPYSTTDLTYIAYLNEIFHLSAEMGDSIWPGLDYSRIPMLLYRPDSIAFLFNHKKPPEGFVPATALPFEFTNPVYVHRGAFEDYTGQFWVIAVVNGVPTFVCPYDEDSTWQARFFTFVVHEAFHTFQAYEFADLGDSREEYYPLELAENNALATIENRILAMAVEGLLTDDRESVTNRVRQFAIVRLWRLAQASPFVRHHEKVKERTENTAYYVEKRCQEIGQSPAYEPTDFLNYAQHNPYMTRREILQSIKSGIEEHITEGAIAPSAMPRYRIYDNGAALGYILDYLNVDWKQAAMQDTTFLFHQALAQHLNISEDTETLKPQVEDIKDEFGYQNTLIAAKRSIEEYHRQTTELEEQIRAQGKYGYRITLSVAGGHSKSKRVTGAVRYTDQGRTTLIEHASTFLIKTERASVRMNEHGLIYAQSDDGKSVTLTVFLDQLPKSINAGGRDIALHPGEMQHCDTLSLNVDESLEIKADAGEVTAFADSLVVKLN